LSKSVATLLPETTENLKLNEAYHKTKTKRKNDLPFRKLFDNLKQSDAWVAELFGKSILLTRNYHGIGIHLALQWDEMKGGWNVKFPRKKFTQKLSHFTPADEEDSRIVYSKVMLGPFLRGLGQSTIWKYILNRETFIQINPNHRHAKDKDHKADRKDELGKFILS